LHAANETRSRENYNEVDGSIFSRMGWIHMFWFIFLDNLENVTKY
jgi:hypothetical protein